MNLDQYDQKFYHAPNDILRLENDCLLQMLHGIGLQNKDFLDFGCGTGYWSNLLGEEGAKVVGIDSQKELLINCPTNSNVSYIVSTQPTLPFNDETFDIVLASWVFQEIIQESIFTNIISEFWRVLKLNGQLIVVDNIYPDARVLHEKTSFGDIFYNNGQPKQLRFFPKNSVQSIMAEFSFVVATQKLCGHSFFEMYRKCKK